MKNLGNVFKFEFFKLVNNKVFKVTTIILSLIMIIGLSVPTIMDAFGKPIFDNKEDLTIEDTSEAVFVNKYGIIIENNSVNLDDLKEEFLNNKIVTPKNQEELKNLVLSEEVEAGFIINSPTNYEYIVNNTSMSDGNEYIIENALLNIYRKNSLSLKDIDYKEVEEIYNIPINSETTVLGKDSIKNYLYTYILVFGLYFIILFYGQMIATSVASEKSNRSMEILVTSTSTKSLIFGKVLAGALAGIVQFATILLVAYFTYKLNIESWNHSLDFVFNVPGNVLGIFSVFAILGYLLFLFIYGTIGALVSRTEDIGTSSTPITLIFIAAFFISVMGLNNPDMMLVKVASFIPFTSFMAMFVRVSMGSVPIGEILISLGILAGTTVIIGIIGSKIYRLGTLMYGNPIKITKAFKLLKDK